MRCAITPLWLGGVAKGGTSSLQCRTRFEQSEKNETTATSCEDNLRAGLCNKVTLKSELEKWLSGQGHCLCLCENLSESLGPT